MGKWFGVLLVGMACLVAGPAVEAASAKDQRCAAAKAQELWLLKGGRYDTAKERRALQQWAIKECGGFDRYSRTRPAKRRK